MPRVARLLREASKCALGSLALFLFEATPTGAQTTAPSAAPVEIQDPEWTIRWSPLMALGDLPRGLPGSGAVFPAILTHPSPRIGLFWTTGNPAALPIELADARADFQFELLRASGDYRRPLDPGSQSFGRLRGTGWRPLGPRGAVIGRVIVDRASLGDGAFSDLLVPYTSNPFVVFDTLGDALNRTVARLEGAGGWRVGPLAVGLGLGYEAQETRTKESNVPRANRTATPGLTAGLAWATDDGRLTVGAYGRWQQTAQTLVVFSIGAPSRVYAPTGYDEPVAFNLSADIFQRRLERSAWAVGLAARARIDAVTWVAYGQRENLHEDRFSVRTNDPPTDAWETSGWTVGMAAQTEIGEAFLLSLDGRYTTLEGQGVRTDVEVPSFRADEERLALMGELRYGAGRPWEAALRLGSIREARVRRDAIADAFSDISAWTPSAALEVALHPSSRLSIALAGAVADYAPSSATPDPATIGPAYERWLAPELGLLSTGASSWATRGTLRMRIAEGTSLWLRAQYGSVNPDTSGEPLPDSPTGKKDGWGLTVGATLGST